LSKINFDNEEQTFDFFELNNLDSPYKLENFSNDYIHQSDLKKHNLISENLYVISLNIQSLLSKFESFKEFLHSLPPNNLPLAIFLQEVWHIEDPSYFNLPCFHTPFFKTRKGRGGGVGIYVRDDISFKLIAAPFHERIFEAISCEVILSNNKKIALSSIYRPNTVPSHITAAEQFDMFSEYLLNLSDELNSKYDTVLLGGDFNLDLLKYPVNSNVNEYAILLSHPDYCN